MSPVLVALFVFSLMWLPVFAGSAAAQGNAQAGKTLWEGPATQCKNCHGNNGEGAFGPDLAGRKLTVAQFSRAVRAPWGIMPRFLASQVSDSEMADMVAYFDSLPPVATPGKWRFEVPANAPRGQEVLLSTIGCGQCHGPTFNGPRAMPAPSPLISIGSRTRSTTTPSRILNRSRFSRSSRRSGSAWARMRPIAFPSRC